MTTSKVSRPQRYWRQFISSVAALTLAGSLAACSVPSTTSTTDTSSSTTSSATAEATTEASSSTSSASTEVSADNTDSVSEAAAAFMGTLTQDQIAALSFDYTDTAAKSNWSNLPEGLFERSGVTMGELTEEQRTAALALLQAMLSEEGYQQVLDTMAADDVLAADGGGGPMGGLDWSSDNYFFAFFGDPTADDQFMIQFGGHHLALNIDYSDGAVTMTPEFVGIEPQTWTDESGTTMEPLAPLKNSVFAVLGSLTAEELAASELPQIYDDVVMGAGADADAFPEDGGILVSDLTQEQQDLVTAAIEEWVGDIDEAVAADIVASYVAVYDETYISWSGSTDPESEDAYFRISGPAVWIEYVHQAGIGGSDIHLHTVYRDKTSAYGA